MRRLNGVGGGKGKKGNLWRQEGPLLQLYSEGRNPKERTSGPEPRKKSIRINREKKG